jgi:hypothetical protein
MIRTIKDCACGKRCEGNTDQCASCNALERKAGRLAMPKDKDPVKKVSENQSKLLAKYNAKRKAWIRGKTCAVYKGLPAEDVHHMQGRTGYADEWAREREIPLLLDERFWLPVSRQAHKRITDDSAWAWKNGYSFKRVSDPIFRKKL